MRLVIIGTVVSFISLPVLLIGILISTGVWNLGSAAVAHYISVISFTLSVVNI